LIAIGSDHGGYVLKQAVLEYLDENKIAYKDFGCFDENAVDYPDIAMKVAEEVAKGNFSRGILICGTGIGISIAANKIPGIRAALCNDTFSAKYSRQHNDANILTLGGRVIGPGLAVDIVDIWLREEFTGGRHKTRLDKIAQIEKHYWKCGGEK
jgi:ribose 5-phosphate isomerase B